MPSPSREAIDSLSLREMDHAKVASMWAKYSCVNASANLRGSFSERMLTRSFFGFCSKDFFRYSSQDRISISASGESRTVFVLHFPIGSNASSDDTMNASGHDIPKCVRRSGQVSCHIFAFSNASPESA